MELSNKSITRRGAIAAASAVVFAATGSAKPVSAEEIEGQADQNVAQATSSEAVQFLYIDSKELEYGSEQYVVLSLRSYSDYSDATLFLANAETGEESSFDLSSAADASMLFSFTPSAGEYRVSRVDFVSNGLAHEIDFSDCDASYCSFDVGAGINVLSLEESPDEVAEELNVYSMDSNGNTSKSSSIEGGISAVSMPSRARSAVGNADQDQVIVVAIDPGHGGSDGGAVGVGGASEAALTWKIADACKTELEQYGRVMVVMTRGQNECPSIEQRAITSIGSGADVVVSIHLNATTGGSGGKTYGAEVWAPSNVEYNYSTHAVGTNLGNLILGELSKLGLANRGVRYRIISGDEDYSYDDGSNGDYYGITRYTRRVGIPGIIVEHAFIDNTGDYQNYLSSDSKLQALGVADATGIARAYGLSKVSESEMAAVYDYSYYINNNADVKAAVGSNRDAAFKHFLAYGMKEGRQASSSFSPTYYRNANKDLRETFGNSMMMSYYYHYINYGKREGRLGTGSTTSVNTMWRLYNSYTGEHMYTASDYERNVMVYQGWVYERPGWTAPANSNRPVFRLYNPYAPGGDHHFTMSSYERDSLVREGWRYEGTGWYSAGDDGVKIYRQYNPHAKTGTHNYTDSKVENDALVKEGWNAEGIGWYGI